MKLADVRILIQEEMRAAFPEYEPRLFPFYAMQEYHLGWRNSQLQPEYSDPGKLLRPYLTMLACQAAGSPAQNALPLAAGIQLIHDFSLIHDDIEDNSDMRRGRTTLWKHWGLAQGINAGDGMLLIAHLAIQRLSMRGIPAERVLAILQRFDQIVLTVCEGQYLDISYEGRLDVREDDYMAMIKRKTAALISACTGLGAMLGGDSPEFEQSMFRFGENLGLSFQIEDDILGIWGDPEETGKPFAADLLQRKLSIPIIYALRNSSTQAELSTLYQNPKTVEGSIRRMLELLEQADARAYTSQLAAHYHKQTLATLDEAEAVDPEAIDRMREITQMLSGRKA